MIRCTPKGLCSWDFVLDGEDHHATLEFNWINERGAITADGEQFEIRKHGVFSGHWTLENAGMEIASGQKSTALNRTFEISTSNGAFLLCAESPVGRSFRLERSGEVIATISPDHPLTRRATVETLRPNYDFPTVAFSFWLVVLTWRRAAQHNS